MATDEYGTKRKRGRPRRSDAPDPSAIRTAALARFARKGFDGTNLREIAAEAGVDVALVARQFGSKMGLWKSVVDTIALRMIDAQAATVEPPTAGMPLAERLRRALHGFV